MNQHNHFWSFKSKEQRRVENEGGRELKKKSATERAGAIAAQTHLDLYGRKGFVGLVRSMPAFIRHTGNQIYARLKGSRVKP